MSQFTTDKPTSIQGLPDDLLNHILGMAPQLGTTCKKLYKRLPPKLVLSEHLGIRFPSLDSKPENLVEINHGGITFLYNVPANPASKWDGLTPYPHGAGGRHIHKCDFCEKIDDKTTTMVGNHFVGGVLFVCPECKKGLTSCLTKIMGAHLWNLVDGMKQIMVPRSNGPTEMWYISSRLPMMNRREWHLYVQSHHDLWNENCLRKVVPVEKLKELNNPEN
jgi:hypothetical protein